MSSDLSFAVVGATGAVGREMVAILEQRDVPVRSLKLLASERSLGAAVEFRGKQLDVEVLTPESLQGVDIALFSAGAAISREYGPGAADGGTVVIDNSSAFRMEPAVPLIVPEVNADELRRIRKERSGKGMIIANPNCSTIQLVVVLHPIAQSAGLKRVVVSTYQSVSGAGQKGVEELSKQVTALFTSRNVEVQHFPYQIAFNCVPQIDVFLDNGYTKEEMKIIQESRKILGDPELRITATAVRVPTFSCHAESVTIETKRPMSADEARELLRSSPGVIVLDDPKEKAYPINIDTVGTDAAFVGRIRQDESVENGLQLWVVADNLRKGAALNAVQIAEQFLLPPA